jgi:hypothetical protein
MTSRMKFLVAYMKARAAFEGVEWKLTDSYLRRHFERGFRTFFGVTLGDDGSLLADDQQPDFFAKYQREDRN